MRGTRVLAVAMLLAWAGKAGAGEPPPCASDESVRTVPGQWKAKLQKDIEIGTAIPAGELPGVLKAMEGRSELIHKALGEPVGYDAVWYRRVGGKLFGKGPAGTETIVARHKYICQKGRLFIEPEYDGVTTIASNTTWEMSGPEASYVIGGKNYYEFGSPIGEVRGFPAYQTDFRGGANVTSWVVLVTRPGKRNFHLATRKEVLDSVKADNEKLRADELDKITRYTPVRPKAAQEQDKAKDLALFLKGAKDDAQRQKWTERFEKDYRTDEQKRDALLEKVNKIHDKVRGHLDQVRARYTAAQLEETAMTHPNYITMPDERFDFLPTHQEKCGKGDCGERHGRPFAAPGPDYNPSAPAGKPLFFAVIFQWAGGDRGAQDPRREKLRDAFFANLDFDRLVSELAP